MPQAYPLHMLRLSLPSLSSAVAEALKRADLGLDNLSSMDVLKAVCDYYLSAPRAFMELINPNVTGHSQGQGAGADLDEQVSPEDYVALLKSGQRWGGYAELTVISMVYKVIIRVILVGNPGWQEGKDADDYLIDAAGNGTREVTVAWRNGNHYDAVLGVSMYASASHIP